MFVSKVMRFLSKVAASLSPALWEGEREWLEQKPLLAEVLLFIPWYRNVYSGEAQSSAIEKAQSGPPVPTLTSPGNFWMLGSPNLKMLLLFAPSILLFQLSLLGAATSWFDVLLSLALSSACYFFFLLELNKFKTQSIAVIDHSTD